MRWLLLSLLLIPATLPAGVVAPPLPEVPPKLEQGLTLRMRAGDQKDTRAARLVALYVPVGQPISPFLPAGAFTATWEGDIVSDSRGEYTFAAEVRGAFKLTINGQVVLEGAGDSTAQTMNRSFLLNQGANRIAAEFQSDGQHDASIQLKWWAKDFPAEPVPPTAFRHDVAERALREGLRVREGRMLFAQFRCMACHEAPAILPRKNEGMPELWRTAPVLSEIGSKFREGFLAHWINDPQSIRPHALMPRVFADGPKDRVDPRAADLAAMLVSLGKPDETALAAENAPLGGALFANLGCIACHTTPNFAGRDEHGRVPLSHVNAKWQPTALREYLKDPAKAYAHTRMPNFRLSNEEAEGLASYLIENAKREFPKVPKGDAAKGGALLASVGCVACHEGATVAGMPKLAETVAAGWTKGCLAGGPGERGKAPDFGFTQAQREALMAFAASGFDSIRHDSPVEFSERQIANLRCTACHSRDGKPSVWSRVERNISATPALTWIGEKLKPEWITDLLLGCLEYKPRPWLLPRMPSFATWAHELPEGLAYEHGVPIEEEMVEVDPARAKIGEQLLGESGGFNCTQCHALGSREATAASDAPGLDFSHVKDRLRHGYYVRWMLDPFRIDLGTKMPKLVDDRGKTSLTDVLDGRAEEQFDAIWQFLSGTVE